MRNDTGFFDTGSVGEGLTAQSDVGRIRRLLLRHARDAFGSQERIDGQWRALGYTEHPDLDRAVGEYERLVTLLVGFGIEIDFLEGREEGLGLDSLYVRDASLVCDQGVILARMGKAARGAEPEAQGAFFRRAGIAVHGVIEAPGTVEGGDVAWIDRRTLAVGRGYRTNAEGIRQLRALLGDGIDELIEVPLPHWKGPEDVFHLMSIFSPIDRDLALVYSPLMPVPFREALLERGIALVEVPDEEVDSLGCNCLALAPRRCLLAAGNPHTRRRLEAAGAEVLEFAGRAICLAGSGGPTCLTRPLLREARGSEHDR